MELKERFKQLIDKEENFLSIENALNVEKVANDCAILTEQYADDKYLNFIRYSTGWDKEFIKSKLEQYKQHIKSKRFWEMEF